MKRLFIVIMSTLLIILFPFAVGCGEEPPTPPTPPEPTFYYSVTLNLDYVVPCVYRSKDSSTITPIQVARNGRISDLTFATPIGETEYEFSYWEYVKSDGSTIKITSSTKFTEEIFGQDANVTINAVCVSHYTPRV
ncbi:MAG: hypothetical protein IKA12_04670 [Clostridia bacterium]|nr:hypothetical protein [Clostridia bacterium]